MEKLDIELLNELLPQHYRLRKLYDEHITLETRIAEIERSRAQFSVAEFEWQRLKKQKLQGMDEIMSILRFHRRDDIRVANM